MSRIHTIVADALALPDDERAELALRLMESLDEPADPGAEDAWAAEVGKRAAEVSAGAVATRPFADAVADARRTLRKRG